MEDSSTLLQQKGEFKFWEKLPSSFLQLTIFFHETFSILFLIFANLSLKESSIALDINFKRIIHFFKITDL